MTKVTTHLFFLLDLGKSLSRKVFARSNTCIEALSAGSSRELSHIFAARPIAAVRQGKTYFESLFFVKFLFSAQDKFEARRLYCRHLHILLHQTNDRSASWPLDCDWAFRASSRSPSRFGHSRRAK